VGEAILLDTLVGLAVLAESVVLYIQSRLLVYRFRNRTLSVVSCRVVWYTGDTKRASRKRRDGDRFDG
jgi:hypothetical protein